MARNINNLQLLHSVVNFIQEEYDLYINGRASHISSYADVGKHFGISFATVSQYARRTLSSDMLNRRSTIIKEQHAIRLANAKKKAMNSKARISSERADKVKHIIIAELELYSQGIIPTISTCNELAEITGYSRTSITRYIKLVLDKEDRILRRKIIAKTRGIEERSRAAKERIAKYGNPARHLSPEKIREYAKMGSKIGGKNYYEKYGPPKITPEQRRQAARLGARRTVELYGRPGANLTPEQWKQIREDNWKKYGNPFASLTPEQRRASGIKGRLAAQQKPRKTTELQLINALSQAGIYAANAADAEVGQVYFTELNNNKRYFTLRNGRKVLPDFKAKGIPLVIETNGDYYHSEKFAKQNGFEEYKFNENIMIAQYADIGIKCLVYWESQLQNPEQLSAIIEEIKLHIAEQLALKSNPEPSGIFYFFLIYTYNAIASQVYMFTFI